MSWTSRILAVTLCFLAWTESPSAASNQSSHPIKVAAVDFVPA
jgi:hypothetical protein